MPPVERFSEQNPAPQSEKENALFAQVYDFSRLSLSYSSRESKSASNFSSDSLDFSPIAGFDPVKDEVKKIVRKDGIEVTTMTSESGLLLSVDIENQGQLKRSADGKSWKFTDKSGDGFADMNISSVTVTKDGSVVIDGQHQVNSDMQIKISFLTDGTNKFSSTQDGKTIEAADSKSSTIWTDENGTYEQRKDGKVIVIPKAGGKIVADVDAGRMTVTFPDGKVIVYNDLTESDKTNFRNGIGAKVVFKANAPGLDDWKGQNPKDMHHFTWEIRTAKNVSKKSP